jgi:hypothetical protein
MIGMSERWFWANRNYLKSPAGRRIGSAGIEIAVGTKSRSATRFIQCLS